MPEDLRIRIGAVEATIPLSGTPAQISAALTRYARSLGIPVNGTAVGNLTAILTHWKNEVRQRSIQVQVADAEAAAKAALIATADSDNPP